MKLAVPNDDRLPAIGALVDGVLADDGETAKVAAQRQAHDAARSSSLSELTRVLHCIELLLAGLAIWFAMDFGECVKTHGWIALADTTIEVSVHVAVAVGVLLSIATTARAAVFGIIERIGSDTSEWITSTSRKLGITLVSVIAILTIGSGYMEEWSRIPEIFGLLALIFATQIAIVKWVYNTKQVRSSQQGGSLQPVAANGGEDVG